MIPLLRNIAIDCNDLRTMTDFWAGLLEYEVLAGGADFSLLGSGAAVRPRLFLQKVPEVRHGKNRLHLDLDVGDGDLDVAVARAEVLGAVRRREYWERDYGWWVMEDPEGNLFCIAKLPPES